LCEDKYKSPDGGPAEAKHDGRKYLCQLHASLSVLKYLYFVSIAVKETSAHRTHHLL